MKRFILWAKTPHGLRRIHKIMAFLWIPITACGCIWFAETARFVLLMQGWGLIMQHLGIGQSSRAEEKQDGQS